MGLDNSNYRVFVNNIEVGAIPMKDYDDICSQVRRDWSLYLKQFLNYMHSIFNFLMKIFMLTAILPIFQFALFCLFADQQMIQSIQTNEVSLTDLFEFLHNVFLVSFVSSLFAALFVLSFSDYGYGHIDYFERAIGFKIRQLLEVPTEGNIFLFSISLPPQKPELWFMTPTLKKLRNFIMRFLKLLGY